MYSILAVTPELTCSETVMPSLDDGQSQAYTPEPLSEIWITSFWYCIRESKDTDHAITSDEYSSPNEAYEAAIQYCLNNLID